MARQMKDSGIEWIGEIPEKWEITNIGRLFSVKAGGDAKPEFYSDTQDDEHKYPVYTNTLNPNQVYAYTSQPLFPANSITVTGRGDIGHAFYRTTDYDAIIRLLVLTPEFDIDCRYYAYWIDNVITFFTNSAAVGQLSAQQIIPYKTCYLPITEQHRIADFLDRECAEIDAVIERTKATIEEYKKLKQAVITEAVTKGVRGAREMKNSGVEWIGEIPEEWSVTPLQYHVDLNTASLGEDTPSDYEFDYVEIGSVTLEGGINEYQHVRFADAPSRARRSVKANDIIISTVRTYLKAIAIVPARENVVVSTGFAVLTPKNIDIRFLGFFLKSEYFVNMVTANSFGISYPAINASELVKLKILLPPLAEQECIANHLDEKCAALDILIAKKTALLTELETYKKSLIYEHVTGKKEVV